MVFSKTLKSTAVAAAVLLGTLTASNAATIPGPGGGANDALVPLFGAGVTTRQGHYGASLYLWGTADILVEYLGAEAGFNNSFSWAGNLFTTTPGGGGAWVPPPAAVSQIFTGVTSGLLDFAFGANSVVGTNTNASNPGDHGAGRANFFVSFANENASSGNMVYLFFDDIGSPDDNHDDMVIRLSVANGAIGIAPIPLPAAGFLLLGGLGIMGAVARRRKSG